MTKRSQKLWRHNSFFGHAAMMQAQAKAIIDFETTTQTTKIIAKEILRLARELELALKERIDS